MMPIYKEDGQYLCNAQPPELPSWRSKASVRFSQGLLSQFLSLFDQISIVSGNYLVSFAYIFLLLFSRRLFLYNVLEASYCIHTCLFRFFLFSFLVGIVCVYTFSNTSFLETSSSGILSH